MAMRSSARAIFSACKDGAEFGIEIGLDAETVLFGGFDGELAEAREGWRREDRRTA
jgi:hypothetical protein